MSYAVRDTTARDTEPMSRISTSPRRILVAEDDDAFREMLVTSLVWRGHDVTAVASAGAMEAALVAAWTDSPAGYDLLVTDLDMPGEATFHVLDRLGRMGLRPPTLLLSAYTDDDTLIEAHRIGVVCALAKPFDMRDLVEVVDLLARPTLDRVARLAREQAAR